MNINVFWDNSNIWLVGQNVCKLREPGCQQDFRIHFAKLFDFVRDTRTVSYAFLAGSIPPETDDLWQRFRNLGITVETQARNVSGQEVAVDEIIQLHMANRLLDTSTPERIVLLTGDGSGYLDGRGFIRQLERAVTHGWEIEVISWDAGCNRHLKQYAQNHGVYRDLESVYENVTFINYQRWAK